MLITGKLFGRASSQSSLHKNSCRTRLHDNSTTPYGTGLDSCGSEIARSNSFPVIDMASRVRYLMLRYALAVRDLKILQARLALLQDGAPQPTARLASRADTCQRGCEGCAQRGRHARATSVTTTPNAQTSCQPRGHDMLATELAAWLERDFIL